MSVCLLFPGQGVQSPGFLNALPPHAAVLATLEEAADTLHRDPLKLDTAAELQSAASTQLALLIAATAFTRFVVAEGVAIEAAAGTSLGAFSAAVAAGCFTFADALRAVERRAELMTAGIPIGYGMAVVEGLTEPQLRPLLRVGAQWTVANRNSPTQFVCVGPTSALNAMLPAALAAGAHLAQSLKVPAASHTPLLLPAAAQLLEFMESMPFERPAFPIFSNRTARPLATAESVRRDLAENMAHPVLLHDMLTALGGYAPGLFLEAPPGHTLSRLAAALYPERRSLAAGDLPWPILIREARKR
jgi:malonate decarboxylase epsilon subunit